jgi:hypothetical protein
LTCRIDSTHSVDNRASRSAKFILYLKEEVFFGEWIKCAWRSLSAAFVERRLRHLTNHEYFKAIFLTVVEFRRVVCIFSALAI